MTKSHSQQDPANEKELIDTELATDEEFVEDDEFDEEDENLDEEELDDDELDDYDEEEFDEEYEEDEEVPTDDEEVLAEEDEDYDNTDNQPADRALKHHKTPSHHKAPKHTPLHTIAPEHPYSDTIQQDIKKNKVCAAFSYFPVIGWIMILSFRGDSRYASFHARQALIFLLLHVVSIFAITLGAIGFSAIGLVAGFTIVGFLEALFGRYWCMPIFGHLAQRLTFL